MEQSKDADETATTKVWRLQSVIAPFVYILTFLAPGHDYNACRQACTTGSVQYTTSGETIFPAVQCHWRSAHAGSVHGNNSVVNGKRKANRSQPANKKGTVFIDFPDPGTAAQAYTTLQELPSCGKEFKKIRVEYAKPNPKRGQTPYVFDASERITTLYSLNPHLEP